MLRVLVRIFFSVGVGLICAIVVSSLSHAEINYDSGEDTVFAHSETLPWWLSAQGNYILQWHPQFGAKYGGPDSFEHASEQALSEVTTLYTGLELDPTIETVADFESAGRSGLSRTQGLAGFTNVDAVRSPSLGAEPYVARLWFRKVIPLSSDTIHVERGPLSILTTLPVRRLDIMECYYNFPILVHPGFFGALDLQYIDNPDLNRDRRRVL